MRRFFLSLLLSSLGTLAHAADMPIKTQTVAAPIPGPSWTGAYIWGYIGAGDSRGSSLVNQDSTSYDLKKSWSWWGPAYKLTSSSTSTPVPIDNSMKGIMVGGAIGYDWQFAPRFVAGVEFNMAYTTLSGATTVGMSQFNRDMPFIGFVGGRVGYLVTPAALLYAKGGGSFAKFNSTLNSPSGNESASSTKWGWTVGGGLEWQLAHVAQGLSVRGEALFSRFPDQSLPSAGSLNSDVRTVTIGLAKRF